MQTAEFFSDEEIARADGNDESRLAALWLLQFHRAKVSELGPAELRELFVREVKAALTADNIDSALNGEPLPIDVLCWVMSEPNGLTATDCVLGLPPNVAKSIDWGRVSELVGIAT